MTPAELRAESFAAFPPRARDFAELHLPLLRRLPTVVCPSFLKQVVDLDTSFPAERSALTWQFEHLQQLPASRFAPLVGALNGISLSPELEVFHWERDPAGFVTLLTAHLWSSGQLDRFRLGVQGLFAAIPAQPDSTVRVAVVVLSKDLQVPKRPLFRKLSNRGTALSGFDHTTARHEIHELLKQRTALSKAQYAHWYVDGGEPWPQVTASTENLVALSYGGLANLRRRVLGRMETAVTSSNGAEQMRDQLFRTSPRSVGIGDVTQDPVLQRFYTELFTQSSGPQIFSTSFVQWTGRELARRAQPETLLLRYGPRQSHRDLNELFAGDGPNVPDLAGSFQDAEMGAYYNWLEMNRISAPGQLTFVAMIEDHPFAVIVGRNTPAGVVSSTPMTLNQALANFS